MTSLFWFGSSVVVLEAEMGDEFFALNVTECVLELHRLDEEVVFGVKAGRGLWRFEVEAEPLLNAEVLKFRGALREIEEEDEIEGQGGRKDGVAAEEINLNLHAIAEPSEDIDVVPTLFVITARRVIVN